MAGEDAVFLETKDFSNYFVNLTILINMMGKLVLAGQVSKVLSPVITS